MTVSSATVSGAEQNASDSDRRWEDLQAYTVDLGVEFERLALKADVTRDTKALAAELDALVLDADVEALQTATELVLQAGLAADRREGAAASRLQTAVRGYLATKVRRAEWLTNPAGGHVTEQRLASVVLLQTAAQACLARLRSARDDAKVLRGIVLLQAVVRGWIERVGWRDATFGEEGDYPPMTITTHLYIVRSPMYIQDTIDVTLDELFDTAVAGEVAAAAATRIQAAVRGRAICGSLNRLHALYPNAGALNLIARRISGGARALNKNIFVFCSRTTRLPPLPKEVLVALISPRLSHCAHADQAPRDQPVASGRALVMRRLNRPTASQSPKGRHRERGAAPARRRQGLKARGS